MYLAGILTLFPVEWKFTFYWGLYRTAQIKLLPFDSAVIKLAALTHRQISIWTKASASQTVRVRISNKWINSITF